MKIEEFMEIQAKFLTRLLRDKGVTISDMSTAERVGWSKDTALSLSDEVHEFLGCLQWKQHRALRNEAVSKSNLKEEWVDMFKFLLNLALLWNLDPGELADEFVRKSKVVEYKYSMQFRLSAVQGDRVVGVDIDGVLNTYPDCFVQWVRRTWPTSTDLPQDSTLADLHLRLGASTMMAVKTAYRESGAKMDQPVREGAKDLLDGLRAHGFSVVLLSRRPYWRHYRIFADTLEWLQRNNLQHEAILFHPQKHVKILETFPNMVAMVDDEVEVCRAVQAAGVPTVLVRGELNSGREYKELRCAGSPHIALNMILEMIGEDQCTGL